MRLQQDGKPCPMCQHPNLTTVPDKYFQRKVNETKIRCSNKHLGCSWIGELGKVDKHLNVNAMEGECQYVSVSCPKNCGGQFQRNILDGHLKIECPKRQVRCKYCTFTAAYDTVVNEHLPQCPKFPEPCPNRCEQGKVQRCNLERHLATECPLELVACEFSHAGCTEKVPRKDLARHIEEGVHKHLLSMSLLNLRLTRELHQKIDEKDKLINEKDKLIAEKDKLIAEKDQEIIQLQQRCGDPNLEALGIFIKQFTLTDFSKKSIHLVGYSACTFYSDPLPRYKFDVMIQLKSSTPGYVSVNLRLWKGEHDDELRWPFTCIVQFQLINRLGDHDHHLMTARKQFTKGDRVGSTYTDKQVIRIGAFIAHGDLGYNAQKKTQFLKDDCLHFRLYMNIQ